VRWPISLPAQTRFVPDRISGIDCSVRPLSFPVGHSLGHEVKEGDENPDAGQDVHDGELGFVGVESPVGFVMIADVKRSLQMRALETERPLRVRKS
jgi:hypothetical protein